jgi:hypothetical protein
MDKSHYSTNEETMRARTLIAQLKLTNKRALELMHTARNLLTIQRIVLEQIQIHRTARPTFKPFLIPRR